MARVQFKFTDRSSPDRRDRVLSLLRSAGGAAKPLFPGEKDPELALIYVVDAADGRDGKRLRSLLDANQEVEYAEAEPSRRLIR